MAPLGGVSSLTAVAEHRHARSPDADTTRALIGHATSDGGLAWEWYGPVLTGREASWDEHAARVSGPDALRGGSQLPRLYPNPSSIGDWGVCFSCSASPE